MQTVVPPSIHECGEPVQFIQGGDGHPANIEADPLQAAVRKVAAAAMLARHWPQQGSRHKTMLALVGGLARAGWGLEDLLLFCRGVYAGITNPDPRAAARTEAEVRDTFDKAQRISDGDSKVKVTGWPTLADAVGKKVLSVVLGWLNISLASTSKPVLGESKDTLEDLVGEIQAQPDVKTVFSHIDRFAPLTHAQLVVVFEQIRPLLPRLNREDFFRAVREARNASISKRSEPPLQPDPYQFRDGGLVRCKVGRDGAFEQIPLTNFSAVITTSIAEDDGVEIRRQFELDTNLDGRSRSIMIPATRFASMDWPIEHLGPRAIVFPNQKEFARTAIQTLSENVEERRVYTHTGWRCIGEQWGYLHLGGAIGGCGAVQGVNVRLSGPLTNYELLMASDQAELRDAIGASLGLSAIAPPRIAYPLICAAYRACIKESDFAVWLGGPTGVFKSELAALAQQHYGKAMNARRLPGNFASTGNALESLAFLAKDALLVVDDFAPHGGTQDIARYHSTADRILRAAGNNQGRGRLRSDATLQHQRAPRGLILATGEDVPRGQSIRGRTFIIEVSPGEVRKPVLSQCQERARLGDFAHAIAGFVQWIAPRYDEAPKYFEQRVADLRAQATAAHSRTPGIVASLYAAFELFVEFAVDAGAVSHQEREHLCGECWDALNDVAARQKMQQDSSEPALRFLQLLRAAIMSGHAFLSKPNGGAPPDSERWGWREEGSGKFVRDVPKGTRVGWIEGDDVYLEPTASFSVAQEFGRATGEPLPVGETTVRKRLNEKGLLASVDQARNSLTVRHTIGGARLSVLHLTADTIASAGQ